MLLLDTHFVVRLVENRRPSHGIERWQAIRDPNAVLFVSVASLWEIAIKVRLGKLPLYVPLQSLPEVLSAIGTSLIAIDQRHVLTDLDPAPPTRDPFDRLLLAQCQVEGLRLVTENRMLATHPLAWKGP